MSMSVYYISGRRADISTYMFHLSLGQLKGLQEVYWTWCLSIDNLQKVKEKIQLFSPLDDV